MDFAFTEDQQILRDSIDRFLSAKYPLLVRQRLMKDPEAAEALWREIAELGWIGAAFPEAVGGFGASPVDVLAVTERLGRHLFNEPYLATAVVGGRLLIDGLEGGRRADLIGRAVAGELQLAPAVGGGHVLRSPQDATFTATRSGSGYVLDGRMPVVLNADRAGLLLVAARTAGAFGEREGVTLFMLKPGTRGVQCSPLRMIDGTGAAEVVLEGASVGADAVMGEVDGAVPLIDKALDHGVAAVCGEALGSAAYLVQATADYTKGREQYGAPLARFQALQHRMADMYIAAETARSMAYFAALSLEQDDLPRARDLSAAKAQVGRAGKFVGQYAVQLHGGMGVSEELDIGHRYMRLTVINQLFGDESFHLRRFSDASEAA